MIPFNYNTSQKTILVTGGAGFIGSNFVNYIDHKYKVIVLDKMTYAGDRSNLPENVNFIQGDIDDYDTVNDLVSQSDIIVHFACETHVTRSIQDSRDFFKSAIFGTHTLLNSALKNGIERFMHISSSEVYGDAITDLITEDHPLNPSTPYASAKAGADRLVYSYWTTYQLPVVIIRPFNNYGPRQHPEKMIPRFITNHLLGEALQVHGDGTAIRDWVHVEDTCKAIELLMNNDNASGQVFNVGNHPFSILDIAKKIIEIMGEVPIEFIKDRPGQVARQMSDSFKLVNLGWVRKEEFDLESTIRWYKNNRHIWEKQINTRYVEGAIW